MPKRKVLTFKTYPYFWKLSQEGKKPFDLRLFDPDDPRFKALEEDWRLCKIKLRNTETSEWMIRTVKGYQHLAPPMDNWVFIHF